MYESTLAGTLLYTWGIADCRENRLTGLASNAQNPLDGLLGDLVGRTGGGRWFLAELKQGEEGFKAELTTKKKRSKFLDWLVADDGVDRRMVIQVSARAHFAIWRSDKVFQISEYISTANPDKFKPSKFTYVNAKPMGFSEFYAKVNDAGDGLTGLQEMVFASGLGVPLDSMLTYLGHLISYEEESKDPTAEAAYILMNVDKKGLKHFTGSTFSGLQNELIEMLNLAQGNASVPSQTTPK